MNRKTKEGKDQQRVGSVKEALGKLLGSSELERKGARQASAGEAQEALGRTEEAAARKRRRAARE